MGEIITIGVDLAKIVFQLHGVTADGAVALRRQVRRSQVLEVSGRLPPCLIGMEACAGSHFWARELASRASTSKSPGSFAMIHLAAVPGPVNHHRR